MTHPSDLVELRERLRACSGPDRTMDSRILQALGCFEMVSDSVTGTECINKLGGRTYRHPAPITASIDAALALCERVLPGWNLYRIDGWHDSGRPCGYGVQLRRKDDSAAAQGGWLECSIALAILDAALTALSQLTGE